MTQILQTWSTATSIVALVFSMTTATVYAHEDKDDNGASNIVEVAANAGQFETLLAAAKAAGLVPALSGSGPLTVFAPDDSAFGALPAGTIETLLKPENQDQLARVLSYHVVAGKVGSDALADAVSIKTLAGPKVTFTQSEQGFTVEGARIVATDIGASNGVIHVIDRVIMPPKKMSRGQAERMIESAIMSGVPMFNQGHHQATTQIYAMTAKTLLDRATLLNGERKSLQAALDKSESNDATQGAWMLRYALDEVMASLRSDLSVSL